MKLTRIYNMEAIVYSVLEDNEHARINDTFLIKKVIENLINCENKTFEEVMLEAENKGISFETITRCKRKIFEKYPELDTRKIERHAEQQNYIDYANGIGQENHIPYI